MQWNEKGEIASDSEVCVQTQEVEVNKVYPIYAQLNRLDKLREGVYMAELNDNILALISSKDVEIIQNLRARLFESGIFVARVVGKEAGLIIVRCRRVYFSEREVIQQ